MARVEKLSIDLPPEMASTVRQAVESGDFASASDVIDEALREWSAKRALTPETIDYLRKAWKAFKAAPRSRWTWTASEHLDRKCSRAGADGAGLLHATCRQGLGGNMDLHGQQQSPRRGPHCLGHRNQADIACGQSEARTGPPAIAADLRFLPVQPYLVLYRILPDLIEIVPARLVSPAH
jgi:antitoxin ParD1/3/4